MYFQLVDIQALSTQGQPDVFNLHSLTAAVALVLERHDEALRVERKPLEVHGVRERPRHTPAPDSALRVQHGGLLRPLGVGVQVGS